MASRAGNDLNTGSNSMGNVTQLPALDSNVNWARQSLLMNAYLKRKQGAELMLKLKLHEGIPAQILAFRKEHERMNNFVYSVVVEMCLENETALNQVQNMFNIDPDCWANRL